MDGTQSVDRMARLMMFSTGANRFRRFVDQCAPRQAFDLPRAIVCITNQSSWMTPGSVKCNTTAIAAGEAPPPRLQPRRGPAAAGYRLLICGKERADMYDILWDDVFQRFFVPGREEVPELSEDDLVRIAEGADRWLMDAVGIL